MSYSPNNVCVYLAAFAGGLSGLVASGKFLSGSSESNFQNSAVQADAFAQAVDEAWGTAAYTNLDLDEIKLCSMGVWESGRSPLPANQADVPSAYAQVAAGIVGAVQAGTAQAVAEGVNPNGCGGGSSGAGGPLTPPGSGTWSQAAWFVDPQNSTGTASDTNNGKTKATAIKTWERAAALLTTLMPVFATPPTVTFTFLSGQTANTDPVILEPFTVGGTNIILIGTLVNVGAPFSAGAVTAKVQSASGSALSATGFPAGTKVGDVVTNTTKGSRSRVDAIAAGTATLLQPLTIASLTTVTWDINPAEDNTWSNTDSLQISRAPAVNLQAFSPSGGDGSATAVVCWFQDINIPDASGTPGTSTLRLQPLGCGMVLSNVQVDSELVLDGVQSGFGTFAMGCFLNGSIEARGATIIGGSINTSLTNEPVINDVSGLDCDVIVHGIMKAKGPYVFATAAFFDTSLQLAHNCALLIETGFAPNTVIYGATGASLVLEGPDCAVQKAASIGLWANTVKFTTLQLDLATTGTTFPSYGTFQLNGTNQVDVAGTFPANACISLSLKTVGGTPGTAAPYFSQAQSANNFFVKSPTTGANDTYNWTAEGASGVSLTAANLDTYNGLWNPDTGNRFCSDS